MGIAVLCALPVTATAPTSGQAAPVRYIVAYQPGLPPDLGRAALDELGGRVLHLNHEAGLASVVSADPRFPARAAASDVVDGVVRDRPVGRVLPPGLDLMPETGGAHRGADGAAAQNEPTADPFFQRQWYLQTVGATPSQSYSLQRGDPRVLVGVMDTGIDISHEDLHVSVDTDLSKSFVRDVPGIDGECRDDADGSCEESPLSGEHGHGTAVASLIGAEINDFGMSGVAPDVTLVSLRVGHESGYVFMSSVMNALDHAVQHGIDVVNMSFFIDPWLLHCPNNPEDDSYDRDIQKWTMENIDRMIGHARDNNVTLISATGNTWTNLDDPRVDEWSPTSEPRRRTVDNSCRQLPVESPGTVGVSGLGPSNRKAYYSSYGLDATELAAPAGDFFDDTLARPRNLMLVAWSKAHLRTLGLITKQGEPKKRSGVLRRCLPHDRSDCSYYLYAEGTSFAAPLAAAVAALVVSEHGVDDGAGGVTLDPATVESKLFESSSHHDCPAGGRQNYPEIGNYFEEEGRRASDFSAPCSEGPDGTNTFYGHGIVNAFTAVQQ